MINSYQRPGAARGISIAIVLAAAVLVLLPYGLLVYALPIGRDSGVFMYTGMLMNSGGMPYVDAWDHKGPILYFFNAFGYLLFGDPRGIVFLEGVLLLAAVLVSMHLWRKLLSVRLVVIAATLFMLTYYTTFELGNFTESWLIPFTLVTYSLAFVYCCDESDSTRDRLLPWLCVSIGVSLAVAALTRPNNGLGLGFLACYLLGWGTTKRLRSLVWMGAAFAAIVLPVLLWIYQKGVFHDFVEQYFGYSLAYANGADIKLRVLSAYLLSQAIFFSPLGLGLLVLCACAWFSDVRPGLKTRKHVFYWLMLAIFCIELASQMLSGRSYLHYVLLASAPLALTFVALLNVVDVPGRQVFSVRRNSAWALFLVPAVLVALVQPALSVLASLKQGVRVSGTAKNGVVQRVQQSTTPSDLVMVHGADTWLLAAAGRRSPTSITYYYPAAEKFRDTYQKYQSDALNKRPLYIIEAPSACGLTTSRCEGQPELFSELRNFLVSNYAYESELNGYKFWRLRGS